MIFHLICFYAQISFHLGNFSLMKNIRNILKFLSRKFSKRKMAPFWLQKLKVFRTPDRIKVFEPFILHKKVLHIGCTDYPLFNPDNNLHLQISTICEELDGMDIDEMGIKELKKYYPGTYFSSFNKIKKEYDTVLVPETIEHVDNIQLFLNQIESIKSKNYIITAPNCFHSFYNNGYKRNSYPVFQEAVHPDHNCWFSPYTLKNCIEKYTSLKVKELHLSNRELMIICICEKH